MSNDIREQNLKRNEEFLIQIGIAKKNADTNFYGSDDTMKKRTTGKKKQGDNDTDNMPARKSARIQSMKVSSPEYKCDQCKNGKSYSTSKGLRIHQAQNCRASGNYKPSSYFCLTDEELKRMLLCNENPHTIKDVNTIEQNMFESQNEVLDGQEEIEKLETIDERGDDAILDDNEDDSPVQQKVCEPITTFAVAQEKLCSFLFGDEYLKSATFEDMITAVQLHYNRVGKSQSRLNQSISETILHRFSLESGLSRTSCTKLLSVIRAFNPTIPVPKTIVGIETRMAKSVRKYNDCVEIKIPWIENWRMNELKGFPPVKIYVRNLFEVISHILIDPDVLFKWRRCVNFTYIRATDRKNNHVYADVMTSQWALETENLVKSKDNRGFLMPLIFYTDGVQVGNSVCCVTIYTRLLSIV